MINLWREVWTGAAPDALFGIATLAAGGSEGPGWHMSGDPHRFLRKLSFCLDLASALSPRPLLSV